VNDSLPYQINGHSQVENDVKVDEKKTIH